MSVKHDFFGGLQVFRWPPTLVIIWLSHFLIHFYRETAKKCEYRDHFDENASSELTQSQPRYLVQLVASILAMLYNKGQLLRLNVVDNYKTLSQWLTRILCLSQEGILQLAQLVWKILNYNTIRQYLSKICIICVRVIFSVLIVTIANKLPTTLRIITFFISDKVASQFCLVFELVEQDNTIWQ